MGDALWVYARPPSPSDPVQRRAVSQSGVGYQGEEGALVVSRPFDDPLAEGTTIEVTSPLPCDRQPGWKGLNQFVDEGLQLCRVRALLSLTGNGGYAYDLDAYPWLFHVGQTGGIYDASYLVVSDPPMLNPSSTYRIEADGVTRRLITTRSYAADETFSLEVFVRGDILVYDTASWAYATTPGLQGDDWQAAAPEHWVLAFAMVKALDYLTRMTRQRRDMSKEDKADLMAELLDRRRQWYRAVRLIQIYELPTPPAVRSEPMVGVSSRAGWY
jgi:hypothetical protein